MMDGMMPGMMWAMGFVWLLVIIVLILAASSSRQIFALLTPETGNEEVGNSCAGDNCVALAGPRPTRRCGARSAGLQGLRTMPLARTRSEHDRTKSRRPLGPEGGWTVELRTLLRGA